jgi:hypothetical protein
MTPLTPPLDPPIPAQLASILQGLNHTVSAGPNEAKLHRYL